MSKQKKKSWKHPGQQENNQESEDDEPSLQQRPKLRARRQLSSSTVEDSVKKISNDTPQMIALREKIAAKKLKNISTKKKQEVVMEIKLNDEKKINKSPRKNDAKKFKNARQSLTPQMRLLQEKLDARKSLHLEKNSTKEKVEDKQAKKNILVLDTNQRTTRLRSKSMGPVHQVLEKKSQLLDTSVKSILKRPYEESDDEETVKDFPINNKASPEKNSTSLGKKNIANDRMKRLRTSLNEKNYGMDTTDSVESSVQAKRHVHLKNYEKTLPSPPPTIEKNSLARTKERNKDYLNEMRKNIQLRNKIQNEENLQPSRSIDPQLENIVESSNMLYEEMEWEPIEDEAIITEIETVRNELFAEELNIQLEEPVENSLDLTDGHQSSKKNLYIVIDTNVFLTNLEAVCQARDAEFRNYGRPIVVVPWTVIRELDYIKDDKFNTRPEPLKYKARQAVNFLYKHFSEKHPRLLGQTLNDVTNNRQKYSTSCPDDEILQTCLQIRESNNGVVLLSYDKNLCNKAMIHDMVTIGRNDPLEKIDYLNICDNRDESFLSASLNGKNQLLEQSMTAKQKELMIADEIYDEIQEILTEFLTVIVINEMKNLYNNQWEKYVLIRPPWTVNTVLKCAMKHWIAAVNDSFVRKAEQIIKELYDIVTKLEYKKLNDVEYFINLVWKLMQCLQEHKYPNFLINISKKMDEIRDRCKNASNNINEQLLKEEIGFEKDEQKAEERAQRAFKNFEKIYEYARDICGAACENMNMPCSIAYYKLNPVLTSDEIRYRQPEVASQIVKLLHVLSTALEDVNGLNPAHNSVMALYDTLKSFYSMAFEAESDVTTPLDVYCCLTRKEKSLQAGIKQLSDLSLHFSRIPSFKCK